MLDLFHIAKPQNCDIQIFYGSGATAATGRRSWTKPRGVSHIYMLLIGGGGSGNGSTGGGSGAVTVWYGAAQNVPDVLAVFTGTAGTNTNVSMKQAATSGGSFTILLTGGAGSSPAGGSASNDSNFTSSGIFRSVIGQNGSSGSISNSGTTFLSGGGAQSQSQVSNYGYSSGPSSTDRSGFLFLQPIIVGTGGMGTGKGAIGCGGGLSSGAGGQGMVLIASW